MPREMTLEVLGKRVTFHLADEVNPEEFVEIVEYVERKLQKIKDRMGDLDSYKIGLLTSINIAEEFFSLKRENDKLRAVLKTIDGMLGAGEGEEKITMNPSS